MLICVKPGDRDGTFDRQAYQKYRPRDTRASQTETFDIMI